jgi:hypothetical protein
MSFDQILGPLVAAARKKHPNCKHGIDDAEQEIRRRQTNGEFSDELMVAEELDKLVERDCRQSPPHRSRKR